MEVIIGADIGQQHDPTAVCVIEVIKSSARTGWAMPAGERVVEPRDILPVTRTETSYAVRFLERLPLGTPYPQVAERLAVIVGNLKAMKPTSLLLRVDATGVGRPIVDLLRQHPGLKGVNIVAVSITSGDKWEPGGREATLGKAYLVSRLQALLQTGRIRLPRTPEAQALAEELKNFEIRVSESGRDTYGAFKTGSHDDLVIALGLATLQAPSRRLVTF
mgnify:CR=1 FL=1